MSLRLSPLCAFASVVLLLSSCNRGPVPAKQPQIDPSAAASAAMQQYDKNGDGVVSGDELEHAPGLKSALSRLDTNKDKGVNADEISARINIWKRVGIGVMSFPFKVTLDGNPVGDAEVTFEPEGFLGDEIKSAHCKTGLAGDGGATIAPEDRPSPTSPSGMHLGLYKVKISKKVNGKETIPAKYNENTLLGQEVLPSVPEIANNRVVYVLSSK